MPRGFVGIETNLSPNKIVSPKKTTVTCTVRVTLHTSQNKEFTPEGDTLEVLETFKGFDREDLLGLLSVSPLGPSN